MQVGSVAELAVPLASGRMCHPYFRHCEPVLEGSKDEFGEESKSLAPHSGKNLFYDWFLIQSVRVSIVSTRSSQHTIYYSTEEPSRNLWSSGTDHNVTSAPQ